MSEVETKKLETPTSSENGAVNASAVNGGARSTPSTNFDSLHETDKVGALMMQARRADRKENHGEAKKLLQQALAISPTDAGALELLGDIFMQEAEQEKAKRVFEHGLKFHPQHRSFEEKIALCILDLQEMKRHEERTKNLLELGDTESWMNLSANRALGLSVLLPGAGHVYAEEIERAAWVFGAYALALLGWMLPLYFGIKSAKAQGVKGLDNGISYALGHMSGLTQLWFWLMVVAGIGIFVFALIDAMAAAERANDRRKHGLDEFGF
jgi:tetratricopeptide (TPR) repeat protein